MIDVRYEKSFGFKHKKLVQSKKISYIYTVNENSI